MVFLSATLRAQSWEPVGTASFSAIAGAEDGSLFFLRSVGDILRSTDSGEARNKSNEMWIFIYESICKSALVTVMPAFDSRNDLGAERQERLWSKLNASHGGRLETRAREIRSGPVKVTRKEAQVAVLAEVLHYDCIDTANVFEVDEHAIANHRSILRRKMGKTRRDVDFDVMFITPRVHQRERNEMMNNLKMRTFRVHNEDLWRTFRGYNSADHAVIL